MKFRLVLKAKSAEPRAAAPERPRLRIGRRRTDVPGENPEAVGDLDGDDERDGDQAGARAEHRYATLHTAGPDSPGHAVRIVRHPEKPGSWHVHPEDRKRAIAALQDKSGPRGERTSPANPKKQIGATA